MKKLLFTLLLISSGIIVSAQYYVPFSQNMFNQLDYNPAFAGMSKGYNVDLGYRSELLQAPNSFPSLLVNGDASLPGINSGVGLTEYHLNLGFSRTNEVKLSYSYHINLGAGTLAAGASFGYYTIEFTNGWQNANQSTYDIGLGLYYSTPRGFYVGLSSSKPNDQFYTIPSQESIINIPRQYYITAGYPVHITDECDFIPDAFIRSSFNSGDGTDVQLQTDVRLQSKIFWVGMGLRTYPYPAENTPAQFIGMLGLMHEFKDGSTVKISYSYDFPNSEPNWLGSYGTHEFHLMFCLKQKAAEKAKSEKIL